MTKQDIKPPRIPTKSRMRVDYYVVGYTRGGWEEARTLTRSFYAKHNDDRGLRRLAPQFRYNSGGNHRAKEFVGSSRETAERVVHAWKDAGLLFVYLEEKRTEVYYHHH